MTNHQPGMAYSEFVCSARLLSLSALLLKRIPRQSRAPLVQLHFVFDSIQSTQIASSFPVSKPRAYRIDRQGQDVRHVALAPVSVWKTAFGILLVMSTEAQPRMVQRFWLPASNSSHGLLCMWISRFVCAFEKQRNARFVEFWRAHVLR